MAATGYQDSQTHLFLEPQMVIDCKHTLVCMITDSPYDFLYRTWGSTESSTDKTHNSAWVTVCQPGPKSQGYQSFYSSGIILNWRAAKVVRKMHVRTRRMNREWFDIIPGFHCREGSGGCWLLCVEVKGCGRAYCCCFWQCMQMCIFVLHMCSTWVVCIAQTVVDAGLNEGRCMSVCV